MLAVAAVALAGGVGGLAQAAALALVVVTRAIDRLDAPHNFLSLFFGPLIKVCGSSCAE